MISFSTVTNMVTAMSVEAAAALAPESSRLSSEAAATASRTVYLELKVALIVRAFKSDVANLISHQIQNVIDLVAFPNFRSLCQTALEL